MPVQRASTLSLTLTTAPATEPVTTADFKTWIGYSGSDQDTIFGNLLKTARLWVEEYLSRQLITATYTLKLDSFPVVELFLPRPPIQSITSIAYLDSDGDSQALSTDIYELTTRGTLARKYNQVWPSVRYIHEAVTIVYVAGYGSSATDVPQPIRDAIMLFAKGVWQSPAGACPSVVMAAAENLLQPYKLWRV